MNSKKWKDLVRIKAIRETHRKKLKNLQMHELYQKAKIESDIKTCTDKIRKIDARHA